MSVLDFSWEVFHEGPCRGGPHTGSMARRRVERFHAWALDARPDGSGSFRLLGSYVWRNKGWDWEELK